MKKNTYWGNINKSEGFTLVELMIVLSIIAILAVVLVPKVGQMKDSVRDQGVYSNQSSVRAFLELKVNSRETYGTDEANRLVTNSTTGLLPTAFTDSNEIVNPFTNGKLIGPWATAMNDTNYSVAVYGWNTTLAAANIEANVNYTNTYVNRKGRIIVWVLQDAYVIWGMDSEGKSIPYQVVK